MIKLKQSIEQLSTMLQLKPINCHKLLSITKEQMLRFSDCSWIDYAYNIMFLGPPSVGKSCLATAIAYESLDKGYSVSFVNLDDLIRQLKTVEISSASKKE